MILATEATYAGFKTSFANMGGGRKTFVLASDQTFAGGDNAFAIVASFPAEGVALRVTIPETKPATFDADFPQAVYVYRAQAD